jgi:hypothetical protein
MRGGREGAVRRRARRQRERPDAEPAEGEREGKGRGRNREKKGERLRGNVSKSETGKEGWNRRMRRDTYAGAAPSYRYCEY